jgi:peptidoglycan biosynthesis protein MviN/MurJ (putative lipid II flippase)
MFMMALGVFSAFQLSLSWISAIIPRPKVKRAVSIALATAVSNSTNIATSYIYPKSDGPQYKNGAIVLTVALFSCCMSALALRFWLKKLNKEIDRKENETSEHVEPLGFRYVL